VFTAIADRLRDTAGISDAAMTAPAGTGTTVTTTGTGTAPPTGAGAGTVTTGRRNCRRSERDGAAAAGHPAIVRRTSMTTAWVPQDRVRTVDDNPAGHFDAASGTSTLPPPATSMGATPVWVL
jgi:hypothetical protein